jgi:translation elongation factor EF-Tu-like GTPase
VLSVVRQKKGIKLKLLDIIKLVKDLLEVKNIELSISKMTEKSVLEGLEMFHQTIDQAQPGDQLGVLLKNIRKEDVRRGVFVGKPGSLKMLNKFDCQVRIRRISPLFFAFYLDLFLI